MNKLVTALVATGMSSCTVTSHARGNGVPPHAFSLKEVFGGNNTPLSGQFYHAVILRVGPRQGPPADYLFDDRTCEMFISSDSQGCVTAMKDRHNSFERFTEIGGVDLSNPDTSVSRVEKFTPDGFTAPSGGRRVGRIGAKELSVRIGYTGKDVSGTWRSITTFTGSMKYFNGLDSVTAPVAGVVYNLPSWGGGPGKVAVPAVVMRTPADIPASPAK